MLNTRQKNIVAISAYTALGNPEKMKEAFNQGLDDGMTINEINEEMAHLYAYCGFAASVRGTNILKEVVGERIEKGQKTEQGREASQIQDPRSKYERGESAQEIVTGMTASQLKEAFSFNPVLDTFLKEHLFADIFGSDILSYTDRELITVAALVTMSEPLVKPHFGGALNVGTSQSQINELLDFIKKNIDETASDIGQDLFEKVLQERSNS